METKKVLSIIFSTLFIGAFVFVLVWGITNFNKVQEGLSGTGLYTQEDLNNSYEDGYNTALKDKGEYEKLINSYRDTITTLTDQVALLTYTNQDYKIQIETLTKTKQSLENQVANLTNINNQNETTILNLNNEIASLQRQLKTLIESNEDKTEQIEKLNSQIANLQALVSQLQTTNALNVETIASLNNQINNLNAQISDLTMQLQNNSSIVATLQARIAELEKSIAYYEQYIANLENGEQVVATFEFAGSVYNIQILAKNTVASVAEPISTDYVIFNYWTVNGIQVDLSTYKVQTNTRFVANVTYKYDVKFMLDNEVYNSQVVVKNGYPILPTNPILTGYEFEGWTTNGVDIINPSTTPITLNTTYYAKLTQLHTVTFMYESKIIETQQIKNGSYANEINVENTTYKTFNGWLLNGARIDLSTYKILGAETFVADIIYSYDVKFIVDNNIYQAQVIAHSNKANIPINPIKIDYEFEGWTINGTDIINLENYPITETTTFIAKFSKLHIVTFLNGNNVIGTQKVKNGECAKNELILAIGFTFNGWMLNGNIVDVTTIPITQDTTFIANITYLESELTLSNFKNAITDISIITSVVFDRYNLGDQYFIDGQNVIENVNPIALNEDNSINFYQNGTEIYVLSHNNVKIDTCKEMFADFESVTSINLYNFDTSEVQDFNRMFYHCESLRGVDLASLNTSNAVDMTLMFSDCNSLTTLDLSSFNTSNVTEMRMMFQNCNLLESINLSSFNTGNVSTMAHMFYNCTALKSLDLSNFDTSNCTTFQLMFSGCETLENLNISSFNTGNASNFSSMFQHCNSLTSLDLSHFNTENATGVNYLVYECDSLIWVDVSSFDTSKIKDFRNMFSFCPNLTTIYVGDGFDTSKCTNDYNMFKGSTSLVGAIKYDSSKQGIAYANYTTGYFTYKAS